MLGTPKPKCTMTCESLNLNNYSLPIGAGL